MQEIGPDVFKCGCGFRAEQLTLWGDGVNIENLTKPQKLTLIGLGYGRQSGFKLPTLNALKNRQLITFRNTGGNPHDIKMTIGGRIAFDILRAKYHEI